MADEQQANGATAENQQQQPQFAIQRVYTKDVSLKRQIRLQYSVKNGSLT